MSKLTFEWSRFDPEEWYEKEMQDVKLKNGDIIEMCWPNAGMWNICSPANNEKYYGRTIPCEDAEFVRLNWEYHGYSHMKNEVKKYESDKQKSLSIKKP